MMRALFVIVFLNIGFLSYGSAIDSFTVEDSKELIKKHYGNADVNFYSYSNVVDGVFCALVSVTRSERLETQTLESLIGAGGIVSQANTLLEFVSDTADFFGNSIAVRVKEVGIRLYKILSYTELENITPPFPDDSKGWAWLYQQDDYIYGRIDEGASQSFYVKGNGGALEKILTINALTAQFIPVYRNFLYLLSYAGDILTISRYDPKSKIFIQTNVQNHLIKAICSDDIIFTDENTIMALPSYNPKTASWGYDFFDRSQKETYDALLSQIVDRIGTMPFSVRFHHRAMGWLLKNTQVTISFPNSERSALVTIKDGAIEILDWEGESKPFHPPLQLYTTTKSKTHYFAVKPESWIDKALIVHPGGPCSNYAGEMAGIVAFFLDRRWSIVIPQEIGRDGYGSEHRTKGLDGEEGREALHQIIEIIVDASDKGLASLENLHFFGFSYGGYVGASFAVRFEDLLREAGYNSRPFHFQSITAGAPYFPHSQDKDSYFFGRTEEEIIRVNPMTYVSRIETMPRFFVFQGNLDVRCNADRTREFCTGLRKAGHDVPLLEFSVAHRGPEEIGSFLHDFMEGKLAEDTEKMDMMRVASSPLCSFVTPVFGWTLDPRFKIVTTSSGSSVIELQ